MGRLSSSSVILLYCLTLFGSCNLLLQSVNGEEEKGRHEQEQPQQQQWPWRNLVGMTIVKDADKTGAVCLDGSLPAYHIQRGIGNGSKNWILQFEGGGWCSDVPTCLERSLTRRGSTSLMNKYAPFSGILSNNSSLNPDFYNWNRVKIRYCDGASFGGDSHYTNATTKLFFRGQRIWKAILQDLLPKGLGVAEKALLSGCSAGGLATFLHCDDFRHNLPNTTVVKCLSDAGFFLDVSDVSGENTISSFFRNVTSLQVVNETLNRDCVGSHNNSYECFFPQHALANIQTPYFILNSAYDVFQFHHIFVPTSADLHKVWKPCKLDPRNCTENQISILQGYRNKMLTALRSLEGRESGGMFINSCFAHCQSESQDTWLSSDSPRLNTKAIWEVIGDWFFERRVAKEVDCPYPCDNTCHNLIPAPPDMVGTHH